MFASGARVPPLFYAAPDAAAAAGATTRPTVRQR